MKFFSTNKQAPSVSFESAVVNSLAPDKGLYFPEIISPLDNSLIEGITSLTKEEIAYEAIKQFVGEEIDAESLQRIVAETVAFPFPVVEVEKDVYSLELYHGPTWAFKDVGARFMARCLGYFSKEKQRKTTVLVATSGDTGGAVADGFLGVDGVEVVILYPSKKVSDIQERQLTTLGKNITALEVKGTFDDCQRMVKAAFVDEMLNKKLQLTSANSINVARWLPQMFYYFFAVQELKKQEKNNIVFSVPSGNFGNICAGMMAYRLGLPISHFVAATNVNDTVPRFMQTGKYEPKITTPTLSNAMDVSDPSNFVRILEIFGESRLKDVLTSKSYTDAQTTSTISDVNKRFSYVLDPHGAVGYLGLKDYFISNSNLTGVFLETAHPCKFLDTVEKALGQSLPLSQEAKELLTKEKKSVLMENDFEKFKEYLLSI